MSTSLTYLFFSPFRVFFLEQLDIVKQENELK